MQQNQDEKWMRLALELAGEAESSGEVPVGAVIVQKDQLVAQGYNQPIGSHDPTAHAEVMVMRDAAKRLNNYRLIDTTLYVTLEPCMMCAGAMVHARIKRLVFGAYDQKTGVISTKAHLLDQPCHNHRVEYQGGVMAEECAALLKAFFQQRR